MQKKLKLKKRKSFLFIYKNGKKISSKYLTIIYIKTKYEYKFGFVVSKKIGKSVIRNKIKRRLKEFCRTNLNLFNKKYNYIIIPKKEILDLKYINYKEIFEENLNKINYKEKNDFNINIK